MGEIIDRVDPVNGIVEKFKGSKAYARVLEYIKEIDRKIQNSEIQGDTENIYDLTEDREKERQKKGKEEESIESDGNVFLRKIEEMIKEVPLEEGNQRYGNKGFINFVERLSIEGERMLKESFRTVTQKDSSILQMYLVESFGNRSRIDYGTGHELNFFCFLIVLLMKDLVSIDSALVILEHYFSIVRLLILKYKLEPAGSHGMGGLDDYQLLPFLFGSSQFCNIDGFVFSNIFSEKEKGMCCSKAVRFIHIDKTFPPSRYSYKERIEKYKNIEISEEPFAHHSITIYSLRSVPIAKINKGMIKMYNEMVLSTHAVIQHFIESEYLPI